MPKGKGHRKNRKDLSTLLRRMYEPKHSKQDYSWNTFNLCLRHIWCLHMRRVYLCAWVIVRKLEPLFKTNYVTQNRKIEFFQKTRESFPLDIIIHFPQLNWCRVCELLCKNWKASETFHYGYNTLSQSFSSIWASNFEKKTCWTNGWTDGRKRILKCPNFFLFSVSYGFSWIATYYKV